jgi:ubiquinone/menaquinone biosynthesis C-methylase UbiE
MTVLFYILSAMVALFLLSITPVGKDFRRWMMAKMYDRAVMNYGAHVAERRRELLAGLTGTVLEIGPGTGVNFQYLPASVERWIGIEPNPYMHPALRARGKMHDVETEFRLLSTEGMAMDDDSVDNVLSTLVLCSVPDPDAVLRDICRILKPGGRFLFMEHVAASRGTRLRRVQGLLRPVWKYFADGCCPDRELGVAIENAGFSEVKIEAFQMPRAAALAWLAPHISGVAVK